MIIDSSAVVAIREFSVPSAEVLISTHVNPDPDAIGSVLAVREMLAALGVKPRVILESGFAPRIRTLPGSAFIEILTDIDPTLRFDRAFIVDCGSQSRIGNVENLLATQRAVVNVDHHISNDNFGDVNLVDHAACATGEILFGLCGELGIRISPAMATNLFAGILTDTGRFRYSNTTPACLEIAAALARAGADITRITNSLYFDLPENDLRSMSRIYATLELFAGGKISTLFARADSLVEDPDSVVDLGLSIRGVEVAALLSEAGEKIRISLRSKHFVNVSDIAASFGGGGHARAAGFRMSGTLESVRERILPTLVSAVSNSQIPDTVAV